MAGGSTTTPIRYDLSQFATVSRVIDSTHFVATGLSMFPSGSFVGYSVWVLSKANLSITAPKGDTPVAVSQFYGSTEVTPLIPGTVVHAAFSSPLVVGDSILLLHPSVAGIIGGSGGISNIAPDGVYLDVVAGTAGTAWPIGCPGLPVLTLADALIIMQARELKKLYLVGARTFTGTHTGANHATVMTDANADPFKVNSLVGWTIYNGSDGSSGVITANSTNTIAVATLAGGLNNVWTTGDTYVVSAPGLYQPYSIRFSRNISVELVGSRYDIFIDPGITVNLTNHSDCRIINNDGVLAVNGDLRCTEVISTGDLTVIGSMHVGGTVIFASGTLITAGSLECVNLENTGAGDVSINGNCQVGGSIQNTGGGGFLIAGYCQVGGSIQNTGGGGFYILGDCKVANGSITNSGGGNFYIRGKLDINGDVADGEGNLDNTGGGRIEVSGDAYIAGNLTNPAAAVTITGTLRCGGGIDNGGSLTTGPLECLTLSNEDVNPVLINGDCKMIDLMVNSGGGTITILGKLDSAGNLDNTGGGDITVVSDCVIGGVTNPTAAIAITGALRCIEITNAGTLTTGPLECGWFLENTGANPITVNGDCQVGAHVTNSGGGQIYINGKLDINGDPGAGEGYLDNATGGDIFIGNDCHITYNLTNGAANVTFASDLECGPLTNTGTGVIVVTGDCQLSDNLQNSGGGGFYVYGYCQVGGSIQNTGVGDILIYGDCQAAQHFLNSGGGNIAIYGKLDISSQLDNTGGGFIIISGDCYIAGTLTNPTAPIAIAGALRCVGTITNGGTLTTGPLECGGSLENTDVNPVYINGDCQVAQHFLNSGGGTITIYGKLDNAGELFNTGGGDITVSGDVYIVGPLTNPATIDITGALRCMGDITNTGTLTVAGKAEISGNITNTGTLTTGPLYCNADVTNTAPGVITANGGILLVGTLTNTGTINNNTYHYP